MARTPMSGQRKEKRSYTLSSGALAVLNDIRKETRAASASAALENLLQQARRYREKRKVETAVKSYYDSLTDDELSEQSAWGDFSLAQLLDTEK
jgi:hypothetical protein